MNREKVVLHVYDLSNGLAKQLSGPLLGKQLEGVWHTGVVVAGIEYYFGGGVQRAAAGRTHFGQPTQVVDMGVTEVPHEVREELIGNLMGQFTAETYDLLSNNCNNFSNELCQLLTGRGIPEYIINLPDDVMSTQFGSMMRPLLMQLQGQLGMVTEGQSSAPSIPSHHTSTAAAIPQTKEPPASLQPKADSMKVAFKAAVEKEFTALREQGIPPNEAASQALKKVKEALL